MRFAAIIAATTAALVLLGATATAANRLTVPTAVDRSARFAKRTCAHDPRCVGHGVLNCKRRGSHVMTCRIFDERRTRVQGRYRCNRLVQIALDARSGRMPVTGLGQWHC